MTKKEFSFQKRKFQQLKNTLYHHQVHYVACTLLLSGGYDITILNYLPTTAFVSPRNMMKPKVIIKVVNFQVDRQFSRQFHLKIPSVIWQTTVFQSIEGQLLPQCMMHFSHSFHKNLHNKCSKIWKKVEFASKNRMQSGEKITKMLIYLWLGTDIRLLH